MFALIVRPTNSESSSLPQLLRGLKTDEWTLLEDGVYLIWVDLGGVIPAHHLSSILSYYGWHKDVFTLCGYLWDNYASLQEVEKELEQGRGKLSHMEIGQLAYAVDDLLHEREYLLNQILGEF